jgi:aryl-alcohol dehydrogenase-like predicted oxidoreductase
MNRRVLGNTGFEITSIGFGAWAIGGGGWEYGWGAQDDADSIAAIHRALDRGINWIDTAAVYGLGHSEEVVAKALRGMSDRPYIFTKCELVWDADRKIVGCLKRGSIRKECESSLRRLQIDEIDLYQIHWPDPDEDIEEGWQTMLELQKEGKIRFAGVSNFNVVQMERAATFGRISTLQPPYSLVKPQAETEILPWCLKNGIGTIVYSPMMSGLLTGTFSAERMKSLPADDWRRRNAEFQEPRLSRNLKLVALLRTIGKRHGASPGEAAIAWTLRSPAVTAAIVGARSAAQVDGLAGAAALRLTPEDLSELEEFLSRNP